MCYEYLFVFASARPVYFTVLPLYTSNPSSLFTHQSPLILFGTDRDNFATSRMGGVSGPVDSLSLDPGARPVSLLNDRPHTRQHA